MGKVFLSVCLFLFTTMGFAQTQKGYVKTKGRLAPDGTIIHGEPISDAAIILQGGNSTMSDKKGDFKIKLIDNSYYLQNVLKNGYVITDPDILSKRYAYSTNDMVLVMETPLEQWDDKRAAEKMMRENLQKRVEEQRKELEKLREEKRLSDENYRERIQNIINIYDENDKLIDEMSSL